MKKLEKDLIGIYRSLINKEFTAKQVADSCDPNYRLSAMNLVRYITLRNQDLRSVHDHLSELGISSLRSCEGYVMHNVVSALGLVKLLNGEVWNRNEDIEMIGYKRSKKLLSKHTKQLFNTKKKNRKTKIMVTLPTEAAYDPDIIREMLVQGMEIARINLSHDSIQEWTLMMNHVRTQAEMLDVECMVYMDLSGPKLRTGQINFQISESKVKTFIKLRKGEHLILSKKKTALKDNKNGLGGVQVETPVIPVSLASIIDDVNIGDRIYFDDGKIESRVLKKRKDEVEVIIINASEKSVKLKSEKGINLPDTKLNLPSLTPKDIENLPFVMEHADMLGYSFVRTIEDVKALYAEMDKYQRKDVGVILKIENQESFENLPMLLLEAMKKPKIGVMIARGDLAVELGAERIAEVQDQIMWISEAAHVPVIWATQVLEGLAKTGKATRAEITDAAKSARAECVMLNKGPYVVETVSMLSKILEKMEGHTSKKKSVMRALKISGKNMDRFGNE